jgi:hypothetical protein
MRLNILCTPLRTSSANNPYVNHFHQLYGLYRCASKFLFFSPLAGKPTLLRASERWVMSDKGCGNKLEEELPLEMKR